MTREIRNVIPVGLRLGLNGKFEFFGIDEVNVLLEKGANVAAIERGEALMIKVDEVNSEVTLRLNGFSVHVIVESPP